MTATQPESASMHSLWDVMQRARTEDVDCETQPTPQLTEPASAPLTAPASLTETVEKPVRRKQRVSKKPERNEALLLFSSSVQQTPLETSLPSIVAEEEQPDEDIEWYRRIWLLLVGRSGKTWSAVTAISLIAHIVLLVLMAIFFFTPDVDEPDVIVTSTINDAVETPLTFVPIETPLLDAGAASDDPSKIFETAMTAKGMDPNLAFGRGGGGLGGAGGGGLFGAATTANSIVFVIDRSSSMHGRRFTTVKKELTIALEKLRPSQSFEVMLYSNHVERMTSAEGKVLSLATEKNVNRVQTKLRREKTQGGTNGATAIREALATNPELILFLTDGEFDIDINRDVVDRNKAGTRINVIVVDNLNPYTPLEKIARITGGTYRAISLSRP